MSDSTANVDRGLKKKLYQDIFRTPDYFWFDPNSLEFKGFHLVDGTYQELVPNAQGQLWSQQLGLYLGIHEGQLRFFTETGQLVPIPEESAAAERQRADAERQRADTAEQRADAADQRAETERQVSQRLAAKLRSLGIDPEGDSELSTSDGAIT